MICGIYRIICKPTGKSYIGQSKNIEKRWWTHLDGLENGCSPHIKLQRAWNLYGKEAFSFEILKTCSEDQLTWQEAFFMDFYDSLENGFNIRGMTLEDDLVKHCYQGKKHTEETRRKMSLSAKGRKHTDEAKKKMSEAKKGKPTKAWSEEAKLKLSQQRLGIPKSPETIERMRQSILIRSKEDEAERRKKISIACTGYQHTEEWKRSMSDRNIGKRWYNNSLTQVFSNTCPEGWKPGMLPRKK
jgi:group I intron endonuclease